MQLTELIGMDVGEQRTGLARINVIAAIPEPLETIPTEKVPSLLPSIMKQHGSHAVIIGLPRGMQAQDTQQTEWVRQWVKNLFPIITVPMYWQDETATSLQAEQLAKKFSKTQHVSIDSLSACILVQDFLMTPERLRWEVER